MTTMRVQRIVQQAGLSSRREAEAWIQSGRVTVNGRPIALGASADPARDTVAVDGVTIKTAKRPLTYLAMYKPAGYTTSLRDRHAAHLITEIVPRKFGRLFPIGRLDRDSEGLILLTNDGALAHRLMHPAHGVEKVYEVWVTGVPKKTHLERMRHGIMLEDGQARPDRVDVVRREDGRTVLRVILHEGRKREIRRIFNSIGHPVERLVRVRYGNISVRGLESGGYRPLTHREVRELKALVMEPEGKTYDQHTPPNTRTIDGRRSRYRGSEAVPASRARDPVGHSRRD